MITNKLFRCEARSLKFHKIPLFSLKLSTLYTVLTHLFMLKWKFRKPLVLLLQLLKVIEKLRKKIKLLNMILQSPQKGSTKFQKTCFYSTSNGMPLTLRPSWKLCLLRDEASLSQLFTEKFQFKALLTWLYMIATAYKFQLNLNR